MDALDVVLDCNRTETFFQTEGAVTLIKWFH